jgi:hypothetical protein
LVGFGDTTDKKVKKKKRRKKKKKQKHKETDHNVSDHDDDDEDLPELVSEAHVDEARRWQSYADICRDIDTANDSSATNARGLIMYIVLTCNVTLLSSLILCIILMCMDRCDAQGTARWNSKRDVNLQLARYLDELSDAATLAANDAAFKAFEAVEDAKIKLNAACLAKHWASFARTRAAESAPSYGSGMPSGDGQIDPDGLD